MGEPIPKTYIELEKLVIEERRTVSPPIITWRQWIKLGNIANITDNNTLIRAAKFLSNLVRNR
jgi:hypothetical protein